jgi:hypothetical protein
MDPIQSRLEILRADATRFYSIGYRAIDPKERELFTQLADYLTILAEPPHALSRQDGEGASPQP